MKIEMHAHTGEVSACARVSAAEMVGIYKKIGYDAVVLTNHLAPYMPIPVWEDKLTFFLDGYRLAKREGDKIGLPVLLGVELNFTEAPNDYLVYGLTEETIASLPEVQGWGLERFYTWAKRQDLLVYQAHPCRAYIHPIDPRFLDGAEVHNGNPRHDSYNDKAAAFAEEHRLLPLSGSDFHENGDEGRGGIITAGPVQTIAQLMDVLKMQKYELIV